MTPTPLTPGKKIYTAARSAADADRRGIATAKSAPFVTCYGETLIQIHFRKGYPAVVSPDTVRTLTPAELAAVNAADAAEGWVTK